MEQSDEAGSLEWLYIPFPRESEEIRSCSGESGTTKSGGYSTLAAVFREHPRVAVAPDTHESVIWACQEAAERIGYAVGVDDLEDEASPVDVELESGGGIVESEGFAANVTGPINAPATLLICMESDARSPLLTLVDTSRTGTYTQLSPSPET